MGADLCIGVTGGSGKVETNLLNNGVITLSDNELQMGLCVSACWSGQRHDSSGFVRADIFVREPTRIEKNSGKGIVWSLLLCKNTWWKAWISSVLFNKSFLKYPRCERHCWTRSFQDHQEKIKLLNHINVNQKREFKLVYHSSPLLMEIPFLCLNNAPI